MRHRYTSATRTEKWRFDGREWARVSLHLDGGYADTTETDAGYRIVATSAESFGDLSGSAAGVRRLLDRIATVATRATATLRSHRRRIESAEISDEAASDTISISIRAPRAISFTIPLDTSADSILRYALPPSAIAIDPRAYPIAWRNGSGAVLLHEAVGHPGEIGPDPLHWPAWLEVADEPGAAGIGRLHVDDIGKPTERRLLTSGELPSAHRRSSFRDVPHRRLTNLVVRHDDDPFDEPVPRIDVFLVGHGHFDAHRDTVELRIDAADLVTDRERIALAPFALVEPRPGIAMKIRGGSGEGAAYPGVICSREGQRLPVGSFAPDILTDAFAR